MTQHFEVQEMQTLLSAIHFGMAKIINFWTAYKAEEHRVDIAQDGENLVMELFKQYMNSHEGYIEADWYNNSRGVTVA